MGATQDLVFKLYGHDESASKALKNVGKEAETVGGKLKHIGSMGVAGFAAVGAAALAFAAEGVKAAIHVEKQQKQLDVAIKNNTKATKEQTKGANDYLEKLRATYGISNEKLIPAYAKLVRSTKDLGESQKLMNLALNISAGTGKDLGAVTVALSKAYGGNYGALTRLGVPIDKATLKTKDFNKITGVLAETFNGAAKAGTETFSGKMAILQQNLDIAKEKIGTALLPILTTMADYIVQHVVPNIQAFVDGLTGKDGATDGLGKAYKGVHDFGEKVREVFKWLADHKHIVVEVAAAMAAFWATGKIGSALSVITRSFGAVKTALLGVEATAVGTAAAEDAAAGPGAPALMAAQAAAAAAVFLAFGMSDMWHGIFGAAKYKNPNKNSNVSTGQESAPTGTTAGGMRRAAQHRGRAVGGSVSAGTSYMVGENGPELFTPSAGGMITRNENLGGIGGMSVHIHVAGSVIHEKDLAVTVRDNIAQLMRRRGLNPAILGV